MPQRLGRYHVVKHLASGGMADVLIASDQGRHIVLKRIRGEQARDERFVHMFLDEARLAAMLRHPNIVEVYESGADHGGEYFFAMEYVHGEDLRKVLMEVHRRNDQVPISLITGIGAAVAAGLHHAHTMHGPNGPLHIVHRDVSPANILVGYDGRVKVADFGIAKAALRTVETRSGTLKGKVSYMSPEQVTGRNVDCRSDVFALGIVLYELATARRLFKGDNDFLTMSAIVRGDIPQPHTLRPDLPRILEDIIMKALATDPAQRFQSAEELGGELEKFTRSLGMRLSPTSIADYMKKLFGHRPEPWLVDQNEELTGVTSVDFDGSASGIVQPPREAIAHSLPTELRPAPSAPIVHVFAATTGHEATELGEAEPPQPTGTGSLAWSREPTPVRPRSRRRIGIVIGAAATAIVGGAIIVASSVGGGSRPRQAAVKMKLAPPPSQEVAPPPPPPVAAEPTIEPVATEQPAPPTKAAATPPAKPAIAEPPPVEKPSNVARKKRPTRVTKPASTGGKKPGWDPNALFPK